jgi:hypothetical protein
MSWLHGVVSLAAEEVSICLEVERRCVVVADAGYSERRGDDLPGAPASSGQ